MKVLLALVLILILLVTVNIPRVSLGIMIVTEDNQYKKTNYHYSSSASDGFSVWSRKGFEDVQGQFERYKKLHNSDTVLYRNFTKDYWKVWRWAVFLSDERYQLPYKNLPSDAHLVSRGME